MPPSRRTRRRLERRRAKQPRRSQSLSPLTRAGIVGAGILAIAGGAALLVAGNPASAERLGRIAGILILLGCAAIGVGLIGRL
ncbi:MAG TPA: hypothetical protein VFA78_03265 [Chloroflexota bacterium]|nr:hypothetical protein [Chloroflexota bacterium]